MARGALERQRCLLGVLRPGTVPGFRVGAVPVTRTSVFERAKNASDVANGVSSRHRDASTFHKTLGILFSENSCIAQHL